ncbi:MAG: two-component system NtrC family response regulator [Cyclobacteriaceae bacterium]
MINLLGSVTRIAKTDAPVLIEGESGTGKELIAEAIHYNSHRKEGPFVKVNMGAISSSLFESEMFGHKKGAFTDAIRDRKGRFLMANGGTLFLDELGELGLASQVKLLRVLQEKRFEPVGDSETITSDFRVICATNKQLKLMVEKGTFREDLYFRINLISFTVPPLRERSKDIPALVENFIYQIGELYNKKGVTIDAFAQSYLKEQPFPGNIRELKNLVERVMLISPNSVLSKEDFEQGSLGSSINKPGLELPEVGKVTLDEIEKGMIEKALKDHPNNLSKVARLLGLNRGQLYRRLEKYKLGDYK